MIIGNYKITTTPTGRWRENCYLVRHIPSGDLLLIDPGDDADTILQAIDREGSRLKLVLLSHAHHDHVGAVKAITRHFNINFHLHRDDVKLLKRAPMYALAFEKKDLEVSDNYRLLGTGDLPWSGDDIQVIHLPGHTPGGVCYHFSGIAFTGDTLLNEFIGRTDLPGSDPVILNNSINTLLNSLPGEALLFPGHGQPWTVAEATRWWHMQQSNAREYREEGDI